MKVIGDYKIIKHIDQYYVLNKEVPSKEYRLRSLFDHHHEIICIKYIRNLMKPKRPSMSDKQLVSNFIKDNEFDRFY